MRPSLLSSQSTLTAAIVLLVVLCFMPQSVVDWTAGSVRSWVRWVTAPVVRPLHRLAVTLRRPADDPTHLPQYAQLQTDYLQLVQRHQQLLGELRQAREQIAQITQVRQRIDLTTAAPLPALVTAARHDGSAGLLQISRGTTHGVQPGLAVVDGFHLVGRVQEATASQAMVRVTVSTAFPLQVKFLPPNQPDPQPDDQPRTVAQLQPAATGGAPFQAVLTRDARVQQGDLACLADPTWPPQAQGFIVGQVAENQPFPDDPTLRRLVTVKPIRPVMHLSRVVVLVPK